MSRAMLGSGLVRRLMLAGIFTTGFWLLYCIGIIPNILGSGSFAATAFVLSFAFVQRNHGTRTTRVAASVLVACFTIATADSALRFALGSRMNGPPAMFLYRWPPMPSLWRYSKNLSYDGNMCGDLAAETGVPAHCEPRRMTFRTDEFGFRNEPQSMNASKGRIPDLIILGDSFGAGIGTPQEKTWASILDREYGLANYNLSTSNSGPWQELMTLKTEHARLNCRPGVIVLWALFAGNDLDDVFEATLEPSVSHNPVKHLLVSLGSFRNQSPIRQLTYRAVAHLRDPSNNPVIVAQGGDVKRAVLFRVPYAKHGQRTLEEVKAHANYVELTRVFGEMQRFAREHQLDVVVVVVPTKEEIYYWMPEPPFEIRRGPSAFAIAVRQLSEENHFPFLDLKPLFAADAARVFHESGELLWWSDDTHWNEKGHRLAASAIYPVLDSLRRGKMPSSSTAQVVAPAL